MRRIKRDTGVAMLLATIAGCSANVNVGDNTPCAAGLSACPSSQGRPACADLSTSPVHCGACGRGCPAGVCAEGVCCAASACGGRCQGSRFELRGARVGVETVAIAAADFDADGRDDLFLSTNGENSVSFVWGRADGELTDVDTYQWGKAGYWVGAGDIDNDGRLDALMLPDDAMSGEHLELHVHFGDGRRGFSRLRRYVTTGFNPTFASVADVDGDGLNDVLLLASRQRCVVLLRGLGGQGDLAEGRCIHRVEDADHDGPTFLSLGRDSDGRTHLLSEGARRSSGPRSLERWVLARDAGRVERVEPLTGLPEQYYSRASLTRAAGAQRIVTRFDVDGAGRDRAPLLFTVSDDLSLQRCDATRVALQTDGAGVELPVTAGDFDGDGRLDHFGLTSWCSHCAGMLYAHLAR